MRTLSIQITPQAFAALHIARTCGQELIIKTEEQEEVACYQHDLYFDGTVLCLPGYDEAYEAVAEALNA